MRASHARLECPMSSRRGRKQEAPARCSRRISYKGNFWRQLNAWSERRGGRPRSCSAHRSLCPAKPVRVVRSTHCFIVEAGSGLARQIQGQVVIARTPARCVSPTNLLLSTSALRSRPGTVRFHPRHRHTPATSQHLFAHRRV